MWISRILIVGPEMQFWTNRVWTPIVLAYWQLFPGGQAGGDHLINNAGHKKFPGPLPA